MARASRSSAARSLAFQSSKRVAGRAFHQRAARSAIAALGAFSSAGGFGFCCAGANAATVARMSGMSTGIARHSSGTTPRSRLLLLALGLGLGLAGCTRHNAALEPFARASLTAGVGLGELKLGQSTLGSVVQRCGVETVVQLASDEVGLELIYEHGQLALLFLVEPDCLASLPGRNLRPAAIDLPKFLESNPCLRELRLSSLSVREGA